MKKSIKLLKKAKTIALFSHVSPDPDTIGSTLALKLMLEQIGKKVDVFCDSEKNLNYSFLKDYDCYNEKETPDIYEYDLLVGVDVASEQMLGKFELDFLNHKNTLRLDHHSSGSNYATHNLVVPFSACAILIFELSKKLVKNIDKDIATALYFAICGDTGIFKNNNTDSVTFNVCAKLFDAGAEFRKIYTEFFEKKTVPFVKLTANALLNAKLYNDDFAIIKVSKEDYQNFGLSENENIGNLPHSYLNCGFKIAVILKEKEDGIHCSFRSKFEYDCTKIAEQFGGGGHKNASGCKIDAELSVAENLIMTAVQQYLETKEKENVK